MPQADDPHLPMGVVDREEDQVTADDELAYFVSYELVLLRFRGATGEALERVDGVPDSLQPGLRILRRLTFGGDAPGLVSNSDERCVGDLDRIFPRLLHRSS